jgi:hypothetical protein
MRRSSQIANRAPAVSEEQGGEKICPERRARSRGVRLGRREARRGGAMRTLSTRAAGPAGIDQPSGELRSPSPCSRPQRRWCRKDFDWCNKHGSFDSKNAGTDVARRRALCAGVPPQHRAQRLCRHSTVRGGRAAKTRAEAEPRHERTTKGSPGKSPMRQCGEEEVPRSRTSARANDREAAEPLYCADWAGMRAAAQARPRDENRSASNPAASSAMVAGEGAGTEVSDDDDPRLSLKLTVPPSQPA